MPWTLQEPPAPPGLDRFAPPEEDEPERFVQLKKRLTLGRVRLPRVPPTISARPSPRVRDALAAAQSFDAVDTDATAYDATIAAGPAHLLVATNFTVAVLAKAAGPPLRQVSLRAWFASLLPPEVDVAFDPRVLYDQHDGRWVLAASAVHYEDFSAPFQLLSVSRTADPLGEWWIWAFREPGRPWPDHPSLGVDASALYLSANMIGAGPRLRVFPKASVYAGGTAAHTDFIGLQDPPDAAHDRPTPALTVYPCHTWGAPGAEFLVSTRRDRHDVERSLTVWTLTDPGGTPELTCRSISVAAYAVDVPMGAQQGGPPLSTGDARIRNAVFSGGSLWFAFATSHGTSATVAAARWYQLDPGSGSLVQEGVFAVPGLHYCYPAIVPDVHGNAVLVVGRTAGGERISVHVSARAAADPPNQLGPSQALRDGLAAHDHPDRTGRNRWGDYHAAALDPDGATVWVYGGYPRTATVWGTCAGALRVRHDDSSIC